MIPWHDDDSAWAELAPVLFSTKRLEAAAGEVDQLLALAGLAPGATILDLPCGAGRHSIELARRGYGVIGVDRTRGYLEMARERAREVGRNAGAGGGAQGRVEPRDCGPWALEFVEGDMRTYRPAAPVDCVLNLWTSFGYFDDPADDERAAANFHAALRPGGRLVMDVKGKEVLARNFVAREWHEEEHGTIVLTENRIERDWSWVRGRWIVLRGPKRYETEVSLRPYSAAELTGLLRRVGFDVRGVYGSLAGTPYDEKASRLVVVGQRV